jgi:hypothetical protein
MAPIVQNKTDAKEESEWHKIRELCQGFSLLGMI